MAAPTTFLARVGQTRIARIARYTRYAYTELLPVVISMAFFAMFFQFYAPSNSGPATAMEGAVLQLPCTDDDSWRNVNSFWQALAFYDTWRRVLKAGNFVAFAGWARDTAVDAAKFAVWCQFPLPITIVHEFRTAASVRFPRVVTILDNVWKLVDQAYFFDGKICLLGTVLVKAVTFFPPRVVKLLAAAVPAAATVLHRGFLPALAVVFVAGFARILCRGRYNTEVGDLGRRFWHISFWVIY